MMDENITSTVELLRWAVNRMSDSLDGIANVIETVDNEKWLESIDDRLKKLASIERSLDALRDK